jgi:hypothetical protein
MIAKVNPPSGFNMEGLQTTVPLSSRAIKESVDRPLSKYNHYARQEKQFIAAVSEGLGINMQYRIGKLLSARWKSMDKRELALYEELERNGGS